MSAFFIYTLIFKPNLNKHIYNKSKDKTIGKKIIKKIFLTLLTQQILGKN